MERPTFMVDRRGVSALRDGAHTRGSRFRVKPHPPMLHLRGVAKPPV